MSKTTSGYRTGPARPEPGYGRVVSPRRHVAAAAVVIAGLAPFAAEAYVGPGAGLTAIGTFLALVMAVFLAALGFVWYPIKMLLRRLGGKGVRAARDEREPVPTSDRPS